MSKHVVEAAGVGDTMCTNHPNFRIAKHRQKINKNRSEGLLICKNLIIIILKSIDIAKDVIIIKEGA